MNKKYLFLFMLLLLLLPVTFAREYKINNIDINYTLNQTGIVSVTEKWEYEFSGCYKEIFITKPNLTLSNTSGFCENEECLFEYKVTNTISNKPELILKGDFCDKSVGANFSYDVYNQIRLLEDNTQFYYFLFGGDIEKSSYLNVNVFFPGDVNLVTYYLHSKEYDLNTNNNQLSISKRILPREVIEINALMPKVWFDNDNLPLEDYNSSIVVENETNWKEGYDQYIKENVRRELSLSLQIFFFSLVFLW